MLTVSPDPTARLDRLMSLPDVDTAPANPASAAEPFCILNLATVPPVALVSLVMALAVAVPDDAAPNAVAEKVRVATPRPMSMPVMMSAASSRVKLIFLFKSFPKKDIGRFR